MVSPHRRIGVVRDPQLAAALDATRDLLDPSDARSEAGRVRRLALLGAEVLAGGRLASAERRRILRRPGVRPAVRRLDDLPRLDQEPVDRERSASGALDWVRGPGQ